MDTIKQIESVSNLIRACGLIGATYKENHILFQDGTGVTLENKDEFWLVHRCCLIQKTSRPKTSMISLLELYLKIIKEKA